MSHLLVVWVCAGGKKGKRVRELKYQQNMDLLTERVYIIIIITLQYITYIYIVSLLELIGTLTLYI